MVEPVLLRFAVVYIENLYPDLIKEKDPYSAVETLLNTPNSAIQINDKALTLKPYGDTINIEITKSLVENTLYAFEVARGDYDVLEFVPIEATKKWLKYENKDADWAIQKIDAGNLLSSKLIGYDFIKFKNREIVDQINAYFKQ